MHGMNDTQTPETLKFMNSSLSLAHACVTVATLATLAGEMASICDTWLLKSGEEFRATWMF